MLSTLQDCMSQNTPISKGNCVIGRYVYAINQKYRIIRFDTGPLLFHDHADHEDNAKNVLLKSKFVVDTDCKDALKCYYANDSLRRDIFENVIMAKFDNYIIVIGKDNKLLFLNVLNGTVESIDLCKFEATDFLQSIYDIGVINNKLLYIFNYDMIVIYKLRIDANKICIDFIAAGSLKSEYGNLKHQFRVSSVVNKEAIIFFLTGCRYIKVLIGFKEKKIYIEACRLNILKAHFFDRKQKIVDAIKKDDKIVIIFFAKGTIVALDHYHRKVVAITNPQQHNQWTYRLDNGDWRIVRIVISPIESEFHLLCKQLCCGYVRNNYRKDVPVALVNMMEKYYRGYQGEELILFTGAMCWMQEIGRKKNFKLRHMVIISAGIYKSDGEYEEIKGTEMHYKQPVKGLTY